MKKNVVGVPLLEMSDSPTFLKLFLTNLHPTIVRRLYLFMIMKFTWMKFPQVMLNMTFSLEEYQLQKVSEHQHLTSLLLLEQQRLMHQH